MDLISKYYGRSVLVIGGAGFVGSNMVHKLVEAGADVTVADIYHPNYGGNVANLEGLKNRIQFSFTDLRDEFGIIQLVKNKDFIFNLAAQVSYTDSMRIPYVDLDMNCRGHLQFLELSKQFNTEASIVFTSSRMVYGKPQYVPVDEEHPTNPLSLYATHKLIGEKYYYLYKHHYGIDSKIVRIANPYGKRNQMKSSKYGIVNWFIRLASEDKELSVYGDGMQLRDYIYIDDVVYGILAVGLLRNPAHIVYNLGTGKGTTFSDMVDKVISTVGKGKKRFVAWPNDYEKNETGDFVADPTRLLNVLGDGHRFWSLEAGLSETVKFYSENRQSYF